MTPREATAVIVAGVLYGSPDICSNVPPDTLREALGALPLMEEAPLAICQDLGIPPGSPWRVARDAVVQALGLPAFPPLN